ncbi:MAG TPA: hypothetical protein VKY80_11010 [Croceibacterium sp.]|nr:hypothetical protein [Croceibacterium sp.]
MNNPKLAQMIDGAPQLRERVAALVPSEESPLSLADYLVIASIMAFPVMVLLALVVARQI